ncbi:ribonuclease Z [Nomia melanderi]|uniref:ribonuclease Z n=1 Tax=Nomia melanderi TaxID=2448451 RepID=UPI0013045E75|nr:ribonuclease Z, mitochondrial [Nomia melanderi]
MINNIIRNLVMSQLTKKFCNLSEYFPYQIIRLSSCAINDIEKLYCDIAMSQKKQLNKVYKNSNLISHVLGSGAPGAPKNLFISSDHCNYIFNCGEGTQRLAQEHRCKLSKIENIFITNFTWQNVGGLTGLLLSMQGYTSEVNIHSSEEIIEFLSIIQLLACFSKFKFNYIPIDESKPYKDHVLTVWYIPVYKTSENTESTLDTNKETPCHSNDNGKRVINTTETEKDITDGKKKLKTMKKVFCCFCEVNPRPGRLIMSKCEKLGIKVGPHLRLLKDGFNITKEDGTVVRSSDVCEPEGPKDAVIVIDCPSEEYLESVIKNPKFLNTDNYAKVLVYHFTPAKIFNRSEYQTWIKAFGMSTKHIVLNEENTCLGSEGVYKQQHLLNLLHSEIFPPLSEDSLKEENEMELTNVHRGRTMHSIRIRPVFSVIKNYKISPKRETYVNEVLKNPAFTESLTALRCQIEEKTAEYGLKDACKYPQIVMLGTGSSLPNKIRNTSAILLRIDEHHNILMDCSEGTFCQIVRLFGISEARNIIKNIKAIFISHKHADHHTGTIGILKEREKYTTDKVYLLLPQEIATWLTTYHTLEPILHLCNITNNMHFLQSTKVTKSFQNIFYETLNIKQLNTALVRHCRNAFGISVTLNNGQKIVYSGDAMPSQNLVEIGKDCDLLIHEATMENYLQKLAKMKMHSTTAEAINTGISMNAKFTLLTHFSQRYSKISELPEEYKDVGLAYDNMVVSLPQLPLLHLFYPCLKEMFSKHYDVSMKKKNRYSLEN